MMPSECITENLNWLTIIAEEKLSNKLWKLIFSANASLICAMTELCFNVVENNVPLTTEQKNYFLGYRRKMQKLSRKSVGKKNKIKIIVQNKDFVQELCKACLPHL